MRERGGTCLNVAEKLLGLFLAYSFLYIQYFNLDFLVAKRDGDNIPLLYICGSLRRFIVNEYSAIIAGFICHTAALNQSGYL